MWYLLHQHLVAVINLSLTQMELIPFFSVAVVGVTLVSSGFSVTVRHATEGTMLPAKIFTSKSLEI